MQYQEKAGTSSGGDNLIASGSMAMSPTITLTGTYNKDSAVTTIGASGPLGSAGASQRSYVKYWINQSSLRLFKF